MGHVGDATPSPKLHCGVPPEHVGVVPEHVMAEEEQALCVPAVMH